MYSKTQNTAWDRVSTRKQKLSLCPQEPEFIEGGRPCYPYLGGPEEEVCSEGRRHQQKRKLTTQLCKLSLMLLDSFNSCLPHHRCFCLSIRNLLQQSCQMLALGLKEKSCIMFPILQTLAKAKACFELRHLFQVYVQVGMCQSRVRKKFLVFLCTV